MSSSELLAATSAPTSRIAASSRGKRLFRIGLFAYVALIVCPIQYWPFAMDADNTWFFALNYGATRHLVAGRDIVWTTGPLAYLTVPQDIGNNLLKGLLFQGGLWLVALVVIWEVFFRGRLPLRNVAFFAAFIGLAGRLFQYPQALASGDLLLAIALILLVEFQERGGLIRYVTALALLGLIPLIKFVGLLMVTGLIFGLILYVIVFRRPRATREIALALIVPTLVTGTGYLLTLGSLPALQAYLRSSVEVARGYSLAMSETGPAIEIVVAFETLILLGIVLLRFVTRERAAFFAMTMLPLFLISFKHAFVRQDLHIIHFFCLAALMLALVAMTASLDGAPSVKSVTAVLLVFVLLWQGILRNEFRVGVGAVTGITPLRMIWSTLRFGSLHQRLEAQSEQEWPPDRRVEPEIRAVVQRDPVASLSIHYSDSVMDGMNLVLYPVVIRHGAYTPFLDKLNAEWILNKGPRFLIFDAESIDNRQPWIETPAMWAEIYRWYETRMLGKRNLLLQRRSEPRFDKLELVSDSHVKFGQLLFLPQSEHPMFWTLQCSLSNEGKLAALAFRVPQVTLTVTKKDMYGQQVFRALPGVLGSPSLGNYLPSTLSEFAEVFKPDSHPTFAVESLTLGGPGASLYAPDCGFQILRPSR